MKMPVISYIYATDISVICFQLFQATDRAKGKYLPSIAIDWKTKTNPLSEYQCPFPSIGLQPDVWVWMRFFTSGVHEWPVWLQISFWEVEISNREEMRHHPQVDDDHKETVGVTSDSSFLQHSSSQK